MKLDMEREVDRAAGLHLVLRFPGGREIDGINAFDTEQGWYRRYQLDPFGRVVRVRLELPFAGPKRQAWELKVETVHGVPFDVMDRRSQTVVASYRP